MSRTIAGNWSSSRDKLVGLASFASSENLTLDIGTPLYSSPEQYSANQLISESSRKKAYTQKTDVYSAGIILFEMVAQFQTDHERIIQIKTLKSTGNCPASLKEQFPRVCGLIERIVAVEEKNRPSSSEVFRLPEYLKWAKEFGHF